MPLIAGFGMLIHTKSRRTLILRASTRLVNILGETGNNVMMRLMGLILMVIAVECFVSGLRPILIDIIQSFSFDELSEDD